MPKPLLYYLFSFSRFFYLWLSLTILLTIQLSATADTPSYLLLEQTKDLQGRQKLLAMRNLCEKAMGNNEDLQQQLLIAYIDEAHRQKVNEEEAYGWYRLLCYYYNSDNVTMFRNTIPMALSNLLMLGKTDYYYDSWSLIAEQNLYEGNIMMAFKETKMLIDDAKSRKSHYGLAIGHVLMGEIYVSMMMDMEALDHYEQAVVYANTLPQHDRLLLLIYTNYSDALCETHYTEKLLEIANHWQEIIIRFEKKQQQEGLISAYVNDQKVYCELAFAHVKTDLGQYLEAKVHLDKAYASIPKDDKLLLRDYYQELTNYHYQQKDYPKALSASENSVRIGNEVIDSAGILSFLKLNAYVFIGLGRDKEAAQLLSHLIHAKDSFWSYNMQGEIRQMSFSMRTNELRESKARSSRYMYIALGAIVVILILLVYHIYENRLLRNKAQKLLQTVNRDKLSWLQTLQKLEVKPKEKLSQPEKIYVDLFHLMEAKQPYLDTQFNRDSLTRMLHTNRTYLGNSIRKYTNGLSISEFISIYRLRYAAVLLVGDPDLSISDVSFKSGFSSKSTFLRLFKNHYGMSPVAFRDSPNVISALQMSSSQFDIPPIKKIQK